MVVQSPKYGKITLADTAFSSGGEGEVRKIVSPSNRTDYCVKIYYVQKRSRKQEDKIRFMVDNPPQSVEQTGFKIGWAVDIILQKGKFIGFMMPLAFPDSEKLVILTVPTLSKKYAHAWHKYDRAHGKAALFNRLKLMNNIAIPIHLLHQTGKYVLQDFKPDNVLITHTGQVTICDMDSIQITSGQTMLFRGTAATAGYAPPEFENSGVGKSPTVPLQNSWDNFALSVVFYQLLFGLHPYAVTPKIQKDANSSEISTNVSDDLFPFGSNTHKIQVVPPLHNKFTVLPQNIQDLFRRSFSLNAANRPDTKEWGKNIHDIIKNAGTIPEIPVTPPPPEPPKSTPAPKPTPAPKQKSNKKGCIWFFVITGIIGLICILSLANSHRYYGSNYQNEVQTLNTSGDNNVIVAETPAEVEVAVEEDNYDYTAVDSCTVVVKDTDYSTSSGKNISATIESVWQEHNVYVGEQKGMKIHISFYTYEMLNMKGQCVAYFCLEDGTALRDYNNSYKTIDGSVSTSEDFSPNYENATYPDFVLFIPYSELHLSSEGKTSLKAYVVLWAYPSGEAKQIASSDWFTFWYGS